MRKSAFLGSFLFLSSCLIVGAVLPQVDQEGGAFSLPSDVPSHKATDSLTALHQLPPPPSDAEASPSSPPRSLITPTSPPVTRKRKKRSNSVPTEASSPKRSKRRISIDPSVMAKAKQDEDDAKMRERINEEKQEAAKAMKEAEENARNTKYNEITSKLKELQNEGWINVTGKEQTVIIPRFFYGEIDSKTVPRNVRTTNFNDIQKLEEFGPLLLKILFNTVRPAVWKWLFSEMNKNLNKHRRVCVQNKSNVSNYRPLEPCEFFQFWGLLFYAGKEGTKNIRTLVHVHVEGAKSGVTRRKALFSCLPNHPKPIQFLEELNKGLAEAVLPGQYSPIDEQLLFCRHKENRDHEGRSNHAQDDITKIKRKPRLFGILQYVVATLMKVCGLPYAHSILPSRWWDKLSPREAFFRLENKMKRICQGRLISYFVDSAFSVTSLFFYFSSIRGDEVCITLSAKESLMQGLWGVMKQELKPNSYRVWQRRDVDSDKIITALTFAQRKGGKVHYMHRLSNAINWLGSADNEEKGHDVTLGPAHRDLQSSIFDSNEIQELFKLDNSLLKKLCLGSKLSTDGDNDWLVKTLTGVDPVALQNEKSHSLFLTRDSNQSEEEEGVTVDGVFYSETYLRGGTCNCKILKKLLGGLGLYKSGKKPDLIRRLVNYGKNIKSDGVQLREEYFKHDIELTVGDDGQFKPAKHEQLPLIYQLYRSNFNGIDRIDRFLQLVTCYIKHASHHTVYIRESLWVGLYDVWVILKEATALERGDSKSTKHTKKVSVTQKKFYDPNDSTTITAEMKQYLHDIRDFFGILFLLFSKNDEFEIFEEVLK